MYNYNTKKWVFNVGAIVYKKSLKEVVQFCELQSICIFPTPSSLETARQDFPSSILFSTWTISSKLKTFLFLYILLTTCSAQDHEVIKFTRVAGRWMLLRDGRLRGVVMYVDNVHASIKSLGMQVVDEGSLSREGLLYQTVKCFDH